MIPARPRRCRMFLEVRLVVDPAQRAAPTLAGACSARLRATRTSPRAGRARATHATSCTALRAPPGPDCDIVCSLVDCDAQKHVWFKFALRRWPHVPWFGKVEDDAVYRVSSVLRESALDHREPWYYGILAFGGSCTFQEECPGGASAAGCCGRCFAKALCAVPAAGGAPVRAARAWPHCAVDYDGSRAHPRQRAVPEVVIAPFAIGPIEVRAPLARQIADCSHADKYFGADAARRRAARRCAAGDAVQAQALAMCHAIGATGRRDVAATRARVRPCSRTT